MDNQTETGDTMKENKQYYLEMWKKTMCHSLVIDEDYCQDNECYGCRYDYNTKITDGE